jgi:signal transduction histidine kinase
MSSLVSLAPNARPANRGWLAAAYPILNERTAMPIGLALYVLAAIGDALTTAESFFTLVYLIPIAVVTWFVSVRRAYIIIALSIASSFWVDVHFSSLPIRLQFTLWNLGGDAALFMLYAHTLGALRSRVDAEVELRRAALGQLRHAERLTTIGKLASGVAHELGTPLNVVSGRAELILHGRLDRDKTNNSARIIIEQSERMALTIRQLLDFARRGGSEVTTVDLKNLCARTTELLRPLAKQRQIEIDATGDDAPALVNATEIQQVLSNLISNAVAAMPHGGRIAVSTSIEPAALTENDDRAPHAYAVIRVRDEGTGIAPEVLPRVFDPFFTTKEVGEGTGLGLSVSYGIVQDHGGAIRLQTSLGEGTTVTVFLPTSRG